MNKSEWSKKVKKTVKYLSSYLSHLKLSSVNNFVMLLVNIIALWTYLSISPIIADYLGNGYFRTAILTIILLFLIISILKLFFYFKTPLLQCLCCLSKICSGWKGLSGKRKLVFSFTAMACVSLVILAYHASYKSSYYSSVTEVYGLPVGIGESLDRETRENLANYWEIKKYVFRRVIELKYKNGYGNSSLMKQYTSQYSMSFFEPPVCIRYTYIKNHSDIRKRGEEAYIEAEKNGYREAEKITYYDDGGKTVLTMKKEGKDRYNVMDYSVKDMPQLLNSTLYKAPEDSKMEKNLIAHFDVHYNVRGLPETRMISPEIYNLYGVCGEKYTYDERGSLTSLCYLDKKGEPTANKLGIMLVNFGYNNDGNLHSIKYYSDKEGLNKIEGFQGVYCEKFEYDNNRNVQYRKQLDRNESARYDANGVSVYEYTYQADRLSKETFRDINQKTIRDKQFHSLYLRFEKSGTGKSPEIAVYFDSESSSGDFKGQEPKADLDSIAAFSGMNSMSEDSQQQTAIPVPLQENQEKQDFASGQSKAPVSYEADENNDNPVKPVRAYSYIRYCLSGQGLVLSETYFNTSNQRVMNEEGYACQRREYDSRGNLSHRSYYDIEDKLCEVLEGYAVEEFSYETDDPSYLSQICFLDRFGEPALNLKTGCASVRYQRFTEGINENVAESYWDTEGNPIRRRDESYSTVSKLYNNYGRLIKTAYFGTDGAPIYQRQTGAAEIQYEYTDDGNVSRVSYRNTSGEVVCRKDTGYASVVNEYDQGQIIRQHLYDSEEKLVLKKKEGYAEQKRSYRNGKLEEISYYDTRANKTLREDGGYAAVRYTYGTKGEISEYCYYGTDGNLILRRDTGYAVSKIGYDSYGNIEKTEYLDTNQSPVLLKEKGYASFEDSFQDGKWIEGRYYDEKGDLIQRRDTGYAIQKNEYNENGQRTWQRWLGKDEKPILHKTYGYASVEMVYDERGNVEEYHYYGTDEEPILCRDTGYSVVKYTYDLYGNTLTGSFWKCDGKTPAIHKDYGYASYTNVYERSDWTKVEYCDGSGKLVARKDTGIAIQQNYYDQYGNRIEERYFGSDGNLIEHKTVHSCMVRIKFDGNANPVEYRYYGKNMTPEPRSDDGCAMYHYSYDQFGNVTEYLYYDTEEILCNRKDTGYAAIQYEYDDNGNIKKGTYYDQENNPTVDKTSGYASFEQIYENGKWIEGRYFGTDGQPALQLKGGYSTIKNTYDNNSGRRTARAYYGLDGQPVLHRETYCAIMEDVYNDRGLLEERRYLGMDGKLTTRPDTGYASIKYQYDTTQDYVTAGSYYDAQGESAVWKKGGYASYVDTYDINGNWESGSYFDVAGYPVLREDTGYAVIHNKYNSDNQRIRQEYWGIDDKLVLGKNDKLAAMEIKYDKRGYACEYRYFGLEGALALREDTGYAAAAYEYDDWGNIVKGFFYDTDGNLTIRKESGDSSYQDIYEGNRLLESRSYNAKTLCSRSDTGWAIARYNYNDKKQWTGTSYFNAEDSPVRHKTNYYAEMKQSYDNRGNISEIRYYDEHGEPLIKIDTSYACIRYEYDLCGQITRESYFDTTGAPAVIKNRGYASCVNVYEGIDLTESRYYGIDGELTLRQDTGYAIARKGYNDSYQCIWDAYYDQVDKYVIHKDEGYAYVLRIYDSGQVTKNEYYGIEGAALVRNGFAAIRYEYDDTGKIIVGSYLDASGNPVMHEKEGYASYRNTYDKGALAKIEYLDVTGKLVTRPDTGYAFYEIKYDAAGRLEEQSYWDADSQRVISKLGYCAKMLIRYNNGKKCYWYYGTNDNLRNREDTGYAIEIYNYDGCGNILSTWFYDTEGELTLCKDGGYAVLENYYRDGLLLNTTYYGADSILRNREDTGYARVLCDYNENWQLCEKRFEDEEGMPVLDKAYGCAGYEIIYDEMGNDIEYRYFDIDGNLINRKDTGYAISKYEYDIYGNTTKLSFYDKHENPVVWEEGGYSSTEYIYENGHRSRQLKFDAEGNQL